MKIIFISVAVLLIIGYTGIGLAHDPSYLKLGYDRKSKALHIEIRHDALEIETHYVKHIDIFVNGAKIDTLYPNKDSEKFLVDYQLKGNNLKHISVSAFCNFQGDIQGELNLAGPFDFVVEKYLDSKRIVGPLPYFLRGNKSAPDLPQDLQPGFDSENAEPELPQDMEPGFDGRTPLPGLPGYIEPRFGQEKPRQDLPQDLEPAFGEEKSKQYLLQDLEPGFDKENNRRKYK